MTRRDRKYNSGDILSREERIQMRLHAEDLERQINRTPHGETRIRLERQLASIERERETDRRTRARRPKPAKKPRDRGDQW